MRNALLLATTLLLPVPGAALTLDFDVDSNSKAINFGQVIDDEYQGDGVTIHAVNPNRSFDLAIAFNSTANGTEDPDLQDPWSGGNLASNTFLRNLLIIAERDVGGRPDDEGSRPAGELIFDLDSTMVSMGFDLIDVENTMDEPGGVDFYLGNTLQGSFEYMDLITNGSPVYDPTIAFGNNTANRISPVLVASLDDAIGGEFDRVVFRMGGSGGIDNVALASADEPGLLLLGLLGAAGLALARRTRFTRT
jgi:hypothetical protein